MVSKQFVIMNQKKKYLMGYYVWNYDHLRVSVSLDKFKTLFVGTEWQAHLAPYLQQIAQKMLCVISNL